MSAERNAGDGTSPDSAKGAPQVRVAVALPAFSEPPEGALTPGRTPAVTPDTTTGEETEHEAPTAGTAPTAAPVPVPAEEEGAEEEEGERTTTLSAGAVAREPEATAAAGEPERGEGEGAAPAEARGGSPEPATAVAPVATAADGPSGDPDAEESHGGRPKKPMLAAAAIVGAVLVSVPFLLMGARDDDAKQPTANSVAQEDSDTLLDANAAQEAPDDYATQTPSASPSEKKSKAPAKPSPTKSTAPVSQSGADVKPKASPSPSPSPKATKTKAPVWTTTSVTAPSTLSVGESWSTNRIKMVMQPDGNLVVYNENGKATWASMTFGENHTARFQTDGNLVIHNGDDRPIWGADVWGHPNAKLILRTDGKVVIMDGSTVTWST
ncbi:mannose-binding protein [Streptomyces sp. NPDC090106]|uniref:mannose-binding protein n=1 Tax=Streptomyces sp. NPDC090106 TaxID=3365946 RepID=UPI0037FB0DAF